MLSLVLALVLSGFISLGIGEAWGDDDILWKFSRSKKVGNDQLIAFTPYGRGDKSVRYMAVPRSQLRLNGENGSVVDAWFSGNTATIATLSENGEGPEVVTVVLEPNTMAIVSVQAQPATEKHLALFGSLSLNTSVGEVSIASTTSSRNICDGEKRGFSQDDENKLQTVACPSMEQNSDQRVCCLPEPHEKCVQGSGTYSCYPSSCEAKSKGSNKTCNIKILKNGEPVVEAKCCPKDKVCGDKIYLPGQNEADYCKEAPPSDPPVQPEPPEDPPLTFDCKRKFGTHAISCPDAGPPFTHCCNLYPGERNKQDDYCGKEAGSCEGAPVSCEDQNPRGAARTCSLGDEKYCCSAGKDCTGYMENGKLIPHCGPFSCAEQKKKSCGSGAEEFCCDNNQFCPRDPTDIAGKKCLDEDPDPRTRCEYTGRQTCKVENNGTKQSFCCEHNERCGSVKDECLPAEPSPSGPNSSADPSPRQCSKTIMCSGKAISVDCSDKSGGVKTVVVGKEMVKISTGTRWRLEQRDKTATLDCGNCTFTSLPNGCTADGATSASSSAVSSGTSGQARTNASSGICSGQDCQTSQPPTRPQQYKLCRGNVLKNKTWPCPADGPCGNALKKCR